MKKLLLLSSILGLTITSVKSQEQKTIHGTLIDAIGIVSNAHIINTTTNQGTFSDDEGNFSIKASLNDTIEITSIQHHTKNIIIANVILKTGRLDIRLHPKDYLLDEVEIKKTMLSGTLVTDVKQVKETKREEVMKNLGFNPYPKKISQIDRKIMSASSSGGIIPIGLIINTITGRLKKLKQEKKLLENEKKMQYIEKTYSKHIIHKLKIDSLKLSKFIYFLHLDKDFKKVYDKGDMKLIPFLKEQANLFKQDSL